MKLILLSLCFGFAINLSYSIAAKGSHQDRILPIPEAATIRLDDGLIVDKQSLTNLKNDQPTVKTSGKVGIRINYHTTQLRTSRNNGDSELFLFHRRSTSSRPTSSSSNTAISAATPASSTSRSTWSELRHQKSWTSTSQSSSSDASLTNYKKKENKNKNMNNLTRSTKMAKRPNRIVVSGTSKRSSPKNRQKSPGELAIDGHSSDSSVDSAEYNSMLHKARQLGFNIRTDGALTSWPNVPRHAIQRSPSRSPTNRSNRSSFHRSRSSSNHSSSGSNRSSSSFTAHPQ